MYKRKVPVTVLLAGLIALCALALSFNSAQAQTQKTKPRPRVQTARVEVTQVGYVPATLRLKRGIPARLTFLRSTNETCATEVVFADYGIRRELPLNRAVAINFTPNRTGEFSFTCGMGMNRGKLIVL